MAYKAEIQIGVVGLKQLEELEKRLSGINTLVNRLNKTTKNPVINRANITAATSDINALNKQLERTLQLQKQVNKQPSSPRTPSGGGGGGRGGKPPGGGGMGNRLESIALGVGFPLLFGGGGGEVLGSLAGSFVGTGFGGQILGGAIGGILDDFISKAGELGSALNPATANIDALVEALGGSTTAAGAYITKLEELGRSQEALSVATAELERLTGVEGVNALKTFGDDSTKLGQVFTQAMTQMQASVAALINSTGILKALISGIEYNVLLRQALSSKDPRQQELQRERQVAGGPGFAGGDLAKYNELADKLVERQRVLNAEKQKQLETQTKILTQEEKNQEILKETKKLAQEMKTVYSEITSEARKRVETEQAAIERGQSVAQARYETEKATLDLSNQQLERAYQYAQTQQDRYNIAIALFNNAVQTAKIEYQQQLESIAAAERKLQVELQELKNAQDRITLKSKELELDALKEKDQKKQSALITKIKETTGEYLTTSGQVISEVEKQLATQQLIGEQQRKTAEVQLQSKVLAAQTALEQKLVSDEIGLSNEQALRLSGSLADGALQAMELAGQMSSVASNAEAAAQQIQNAINLQNMLRSGGNENGAPQQAAEGAYWSGGFKAFADGGVVSKPTLGLVGEGGESEYIIPASKMDEAMSRYAQGQRGSSVIPSSINPQVNVTTGPVMNMNGSNYVSQQDFMTGLQAASRRGAELALNVLQKSNNARRAVGI